MQIDRMLRDARRRAGLSQSQLAARARTSQPAVARYEAGRAVPSIATLERLLAATASSLLLGAKPRASGGTRGTVRRALLRRARGRLLEAAKRRGVRNVRVFGSVARAEDTTSSDVDLLVELEPDRTLIDLIGFKQDAEEILGVPVDAVAPAFMKDRIRRRALREAREV